MLHPSRRSTDTSSLPSWLEAGSLTCRAWDIEDGTALFDAVQSSFEHLEPWMPWAAGWTRAAADAFIAGSLYQGHRARQAGRGDAMYAMVDAEGQVVGGCGLHARLGVGGLEIGYWVRADRTRRGLATLAAALLTEAAFTLPEVDRVEIHHDQANVASGRVPARLGFEQVAMVRDGLAAPGESGVEVQWRLLRSAFAACSAAQLLATARHPAPGRDRPGS